MKTFLRRIIYYIIGLLSFFDMRKQDVVILCYHGFSRENWRFNIDPHVFEKQIQYLKKQFQIISPIEFEEYLNGKKIFSKQAVLLTIDDGYKDIMSVHELFKKNDIIPLIFLLSDSKRVNKTEIGNEKEFLSKNDIEILLKDGWMIGSHTATHPDLSILKTEELTIEIQNSKKDLESLLNISVKYIAFPRGKYNAEVLEITKQAGYSGAFTMDDDMVNPQTDRFIIPRVGVDRTHSFTEFGIITKPLAIDFRKFVKKYFPSLGL